MRIEIAAAELERPMVRAMGRRRRGRKDMIGDEDGDEDGDDGGSDDDDRKCDLQRRGLMCTRWCCYSIAICLR